MAQLAMGSRLLRCQNASTLGQAVGSFSQKRTYLTKVPTFKRAPQKLKPGLNKFRDEVFIPLNLTEQQKLLIYRKKHQGTLDEHPVTVAISEKEEYQLRPMEFTAQPRNAEANAVIRRMRSAEDWKVLPAFLTALHQVNRKLNMEMVVRRAGRNNAMLAILEAAKAKSTGFSLREPRLAEKIFFELHLRAQAEGFKGPELDRLLSLAEEFVDVMSLPRHANRLLSQDARRRPAVIAVLLELSAARALDRFAGKDADGLVRAYSDRLLASLEHSFHLDMNPPQIKVPVTTNVAENASSSENPLTAAEKIQKKEYRNYQETELRLEQNVPIFHALRLAQKLPLSATTLKAFQKHEQALRQWIKIQKNAAPTLARQKPGRGSRQVAALVN
ncbi:uncharacterized protein BO72DRAFT_422223 [Aspergillus fijiensis CBS 313.89]|uniref:Uncharacterized protein n=1 Tax=Aspergillus fijiensis CBS 313.89 TaxID=1448319 RepID=A0A8G1W1J3_9EURO|nr:uncharacterized protein BO72DRAFT_422223 [Aspergillus fijiensis CBS 313.89]RAK81000.1 hypothetical protein BO72DRAFT_422223 [Aspergillus fijiensis CBS 313.89]